MLALGLIAAALLASVALSMFLGKVLVGGANSKRVVESSSYYSAIKIGRDAPVFTANSTMGNLTFPVSGKVNVLVPQYIHCPDICQWETSIMLGVFQKLVENSLQDKVVFITIGVDPWDENLEMAKNYQEVTAGKWLDRGIVWVWVLDSPEKMEEIWKAYNMYAQKEENGLVTHTGGFYIVSPDGRLLYFISPSQAGWRNPDKVADGLWEKILEAMNSPPQG